MEIRKYISGIQHIGIPTRDIVSTINFYEGLGFSLEYRTSDGAVAFLRLGNLVIETYADESAVLRSGAIDHIALDVTDIDRVFKEILSGGYELLDASVQSLPFWEHGVRFFTIVGVNGEKIEFCERLKSIEV